MTLGFHEQLDDRSLWCLETFTSGTLSRKDYCEHTLAESLMSEPRSKLWMWYPSR